MILFYSWPVPFLLFCMEAHCCQEKEKKDEKYMIDNNDYDYELSCK